MALGRESERDQLLAEIAEMYYVQRLTQQAIASRLGINRSTVSRMLADAQERQIVEIHINRPLRFVHELEDRLVADFGLERASVVDAAVAEPAAILGRLGLAGAWLLSDVLKDGMVVGMTWGSTLKAVVDMMVQEQYPLIRVVQLAGALGAHADNYDSAPLILRLADRVGGTPVLLNAPLLVESASAARMLASNPSNQAAIRLCKTCDVVLVGIGVMDPNWSTLYLGGHITLEELEQLRMEGAVGDACGFPFDKDGRPVGSEWSGRVVGVSREELLATPVRIGLAGGLAKVDALYGALRGGYVTHLITDSDAASGVVRLAEQAQETSTLDDEHESHKKTGR